MEPSSASPRSRQELRLMARGFMHDLRRRMFPLQGHDKDIRIPCLLMDVRYFGSFNGIGNDC